MSDYDWEYGGTGGYQAPEGEGFGWTVLLAVVLALLLHVGFLVWGVGTLIKVDPVEVEAWESRPMRLEAVDMESVADAVKPEEENIERREDEADLVSSFEDALPEQETLDLNVEAVAESALPEMEVEKVVLPGIEDGDLPEPSIGPQTENVEAIVGQMEDLFPPANTGQVVVDPGKPVSDLLDQQVVAAELGRMKGAGGEVQPQAAGGYTGLEEYARMAPGQLVENQASIGSDLLFGFNSSTLKEDARGTLLTVAMLIERNPEMFCWVEGHTDLIGGEVANRVLSQERGMAVKNWLREALDLPEDRILVRAMGKSQPVVAGGTVAEQAPNRRVDIKMREERPPAAGAAVIVPQEETVMEAEEVVDEPLELPAAEERIPNAERVDDLGGVEERPGEAGEIPRALPVEEVTGR